MRTTRDLVTIITAAFIAACSNGNMTGGDAADVRVDAASDRSIDTAADVAIDVPMDTNVRPDVAMDVQADRVLDVAADVPMDVPHDVQCDAACPDHPNATGSCIGGHCGIICMTGFADCDHDPLNGCEVDTNGSGLNCGTCGHACGATEGCTAGACTACATGQIACGGTCTDVTTDVANCGTCAMACPAAGPHQSASCAASACQLTCATGFTDCDSSPMNGCEANLQGDIMNCGACGHACVVPSGLSAVCVAGVCGISMCPAGTGDCDGNTVNGCEANTLMSATNCGMCGNACPFGANSTASCAGGLCGLTCTNPFADCDGNAANGCEVNLNNGTTASGAVNNCGACGVNCPAQPGTSNSAAVCNAGNCAIQCTDAANFLNCNGLNADGCEQAINDATHCGSCINNCVTSLGTGAICLSNRTCSTNPTNTSCGVATVVPTVNPGVAPVVFSGPLPHGTSEQWFRVTFSMRAGTPTTMYASTPTVQLTPPAGRPMLFDISTGSCAAHTGAIGGASEGSSGLTQWSFTDVATDPSGATLRSEPIDPSTATFYIRVHNAAPSTAPDSNLPFTLRITNP